MPSRRCGPGPRRTRSCVGGCSTWGGSPWNPPLTTDDWPYLYLSGPGLPRYHLLVGLACLGLGLLLRRSLFRPGEPVDGAMLLLGMGFMLLEVAGVSRSVLLFGTTWTVNAYVVGAIFGMTLLANLVASRWPVAVTGWPAAGLVASVLALAVVPTAGLAALPLPLRVALGGGFLVLPVFFSGLIFVTVWAATERKDLALGSNLLGSLLGGIASMLSMLIGFQALTLLTLGVYLGRAPDALARAGQGPRPRLSGAAPASSPGCLSGASPGGTLARRASSSTSARAFSAASSSVLAAAVMPQLLDRADHRPPSSWYS